MEIISIPLKGHLQHGDSKKNSRIITVGEIQTMSAGTGIFHSEVNASPVEPVEFLQIWDYAERTGIRILSTRILASKTLERPNELAVIRIARRQYSRFTSTRHLGFLSGKVEVRKETRLSLAPKAMAAYTVFLIEGEIVVDGEVLKRRDGMGVYDTKSFELETLKDSHILLIEVPM